jgi:hypothetical protein
VPWGSVVSPTVPAGVLGAMWSVLRQQNHEYEGDIEEQISFVCFESDCQAYSLMGALSSSKISGVGALATRAKKRRFLSFKGIESGA